MLRWTAAAAIATLFTLNVLAEERDLPEIDLLVFGDAYWFAGSHDPAIEGQNGFWLRRVYLTFDHDLGKRLSTRLRFEANHPGDFMPDDQLESFVKDVYLKWKGDRHEATLGISPTPAFDILETAWWGYRVVEKTPLDLQKMASSRDLGVAVKGKIAGNDAIRYRAMLGNGSSIGTETNEGKKVMGAVTFHPHEELLFDLYADFENRPGPTNRTTFQFFGMYRTEGGRVGLQYAHQDRDADPDLDLLSLFGVLDLGEKITLLGRVDRTLDPNPAGDTIAYLPFDPTAEATLIIAGVDFKVHPKVSFIPNVEAVLYDGQGGAPDPDNDLVGRVTFVFQY